MSRAEVKRWSQVVDVARTAPRESMAHDDGTYFWREFRVRPLSADEFAALRAAEKIGRFVAYQPFVIEARRVDGTAERVPTNPWEWSLWQLGASPAALIDEMMGDSGFQAAESLVPEHAALAGHYVALRAAWNAEYEAEKAAGAAATALDDFNRTNNRTYAAKIAGQSEADAKKVANRMVAKLKPRHQELKAAVRAANAAHAAAAEAVKAVRANRPKLPGLPKECENK